MHSYSCKLHIKDVGLKNSHSTCHHAVELTAFSYLSLRSVCVYVSNAKQQNCSSAASRFSGGQEIPTLF
jgi:hypothetical protein